MGEEPEKKPSTLVKILKVVYLVVMIGYTIYSVIVAIQAYVKYKEIAGQFKNLIQNWRSDVILDIEAVSFSGSCSTGYSPFLTYEWPGTVQGCDCTSITTTYSASANVTLKKEFYRSTCNTTQTTLGCAQEAATDAKTVSYSWGTGLSQKKVCAKRQADDDFVKLAEKMKEDGTCETGYKLCGGKTEKLYGLCVPTSYTTCPIMDIRAEPPALSLSSEYTFLTGTDLYISKSANLDGAPMSEVFMNENGVCKASVGVSTTTKSNHPLMKTNIPSCTDFEGTFSRFSSTQEAGRRDLFVLNGINTFTPNQLDTYVTNSEKLINFKRGYIGFKPECRKDVAKMANNDDEVKSITGAQTGLLVIAIIVGIFIGVVFTFLEICVLLECGTEEQQAKRKRCMDSRKWLSIIVKVFHIIILIWAVAISSKIRGYFNDLATKKCGADSTNTDLANLADQINNFVYSKNRSSLIVTSIMIFIDILMIIYQLCCAKKKENNVNSQKNDPEQMPAKQSQSNPPQTIQPTPMASGPNPYAEGQPSMTPFPQGPQQGFQPALQPGFPQNGYGGQTPFPAQPQYQPVQNLH